MYIESQGFQVSNQLRVLTTISLFINLNLNFLKEAFNNGEKTDLSGSLIIAMNIVSFKRELSSSLVPLILQFSLKHFIYYFPYKTVSKVAPFFALHILSVK